MNASQTNSFIRSKNTVATANPWMVNSFRYWLLTVMMIVSIDRSHGWAAAAGGDSAAPAVEIDQNTEPTEYRSVFINDPNFGKDPFYPDSKRRQATPIKPTQSITPINANPMGVIVEGLELKGISLGANKKLAIINNYTFAEGEERNVKVGNQAVKVRCISIQERSATVMVNGRTRKELNLRDGL